LNFLTIDGWYEFINLPIRIGLVVCLSLLSGCSNDDIKKEKAKKNEAEKVSIYGGKCAKFNCIEASPFWEVPNGYTGLAKICSYGVVISIQGFKDGKFHGSGYNWYPDGQLHIENQFKNGEPHGFDRWWYPNGQLMYEILYKDGEVEDQQVEYYNEKGEIIGIATYLNGDRDNCEGECF
jgi:antitoxin component YwqK of YwqJK toxin-antitoxin module